VRENVALEVNDDAPLPSHSRQLAKEDSGLDLLVVSSETTSFTPERPRSTSPRRRSIEAYAAPFWVPATSTA
jgi:hypothetical protein